MSDKINLKYAYQCAVEAHKKFQENHSSIRGATINFELMSGVKWNYKDGEAVWWEEGLDEDDCYGWEIIFIVYEDDFCIHFDCNDGCGNRHIDVVFLKSERVGEEE